jgi:hypothetical protein
MFQKNYRNEVEVVGKTDRQTERKLLDLYQMKSELSDEHNAIFDVDRARANNLYRKMRAIEDEMDLLKAQTGTQLRYR